MKPETRADQAFESWLADGPTRMPEHLVDSIVTQLEQTHQRKHLWLPGREQMNRMMIAVGGVAAVALLAVVGLYFVGRGSGIGSAPTPSPTPTALPTSGAVVPGMYFADSFGYRYTFTISGQGWSSSSSAGNIIVVKGNESGTDFAAMWLGWTTDPTQIVWGTACQWTGTGFTPGPSVDELANAIAGLSGFRSTQPTPVTVSGYSGKELKLTVPSNADLSSCAGETGVASEYRSWDGRYYQAAGQTDDLRILDLDGNRTLGFTSRFAGTPSVTLTEQADMFASLEIAPVPAASATATP
jgi:hypothetical protein